MPSGEFDGEVARLRLGEYRFKVAKTDAEVDQVHRLNYDTFVREVAHYGDPGTDRLIDKFHAKNTYLIALHGGDVVGMAALHDRPPFSIASRVVDPHILERPGERPLEVRLLAIRPAHRHRPVFSGLMWIIHEHARRSGHTRLLISALEERVSIYLKLGFRSLGPAVRSGQAAFVPMALDLDQPPECLRRTVMLWEKRLKNASNPLDSSSPSA